jgi:CelD/BcsL family acetyltransferase involved in cellulose biosynthesis
MLTFERVDLKPADWARILARFQDRTLCQSPAWLAFLEETQRGEIVVAVLREGNAVLGYFAGLLIRKCGVRILGSPFPGWTSSYMGVVLEPEIPRVDALQALKEFAFRDLKCLHLEVMDRHVSTDAVRDRYLFTSYNSFEVDLSLDEDDIFKRMSTTCRRCIRQAVRSGMVIQEACDPGFVDDYYSQLIDVFANQRLVPTYSRGRVAALIRHLQPTGNLVLLRAINAEGLCIATVISLAMNNRAELWGTASWRSYQYQHPNELMFWHLFRYWKQRNVNVFDFGGAGEYKKKYGSYQISVPWIRVSRYPVLPLLRNSAALLATTRQKFQGAWHSVASPTSGPSQRIRYYGCGGWGRSTSTG